MNKNSLILNENTNVSLQQYIFKLYNNNDIIEIINVCFCTNRSYKVKYKYKNDYKIHFIVIYGNYSYYTKRINPLYLLFNSQRRENLINDLLIDKND